MAAPAEPTGRLARRVVALPYGLWTAEGRVARVELRAIDGADELALAEAAASGASVVAAGNLLIGRCADVGTAALGELAGRLVLGDREVVLRALHVMNLGDRVEARTRCAACGTLIEYDLDLDHPPEAPPEPGPSHRLAGPGGAAIDCRLLTGADLERVGAGTAADPISALAAAATGGAAVSPDELGQALARLDPNAETAAVLACPGCGGTTRLWLDAFELIRRRLAEAGGIFAQLHALASAYGWSEAAVLALPRGRRLRYCAMIAAGGRA